MAQQRTVVAQVQTLVEQEEVLVDLYTRKLAALDELKQSLLHQAFSGQL
jgi:type I restriction enzyme S subunit